MVIKLRFSILNLTGACVTHLHIAKETCKYRSTSRRMQGNVVLVSAFEERRKTNAIGRTQPHSGGGS